MVCVAQELRVECIVHNCASTVGKEKLEVTFPASTPVHALISHVAQKMNYDPNSFQLTLQTPDAITRVHYFKISIYYFFGILFFIISQYFILGFHRKNSWFSGISWTLY